jgi:hypothetical protein
MKKYLIQRDIPGVEKLVGQQLKDAATASNAALAQLPKVQWQQSYVTKDHTWCVYLADTEADILEHAKLSGFPANRIMEVDRIIDPVTAG